MRGNHNYYLQDCNPPPWSFSVISGNDGRNFYRAAALGPILLLLIILIGYYLRSLWATGG